jgi:predicted MFS family arabinose efflux permease
LTISAVSLLRSRSLAALLLAELVSLTGSAMTFVALPWFVLITTGSTARMGWVLAAELAPVGLLGIPAGGVIGRLGAKVTMNVSDAARIPLMTSIPVLHWTGHLSFPLLLVLVFVMGCFLAPYYASSRLVLPEVVGEDEQLVAQGSAFVQAVQQLTQLAGPVLGGLLIAWISAPAVLLIDACTYAFSFVVILLFVRAGSRVAPDDSSRGVFAGLRYLARDRLLGPVLVVASIFGFVIQGLVATMPVLVLRRYDADARIVGFLFAAYGGGALIGSLVVSQVVRKVALLRLVLVAILVMALPLWLLAISLPWSLVIAVLAAFALCGPFVNAPLIAIITVRTPKALRAKAMTALMTISGVAGPLGFLAAGESLQYVSLTVVFLVVAGGFTLGALAFAAVLSAQDEPVELPGPGWEQEGDAVPAVGLAAVAPVEARPNAMPS